MTIEDRIQDFSQLKNVPPFCWLICFEERPLQGIPPGGNGPHLLAFSTEANAQAFLSGREKYFGNEPLSVIKIDSADSLKSLLGEPCRDPRYAAPPCGLVFDFDYSTGKAKQVISPAKASKSAASEIAQSFLAPPIPEHSQRAPRDKSAKRTAGIIGGVAGIIILVFVGVGVIRGMKSGKIPAFAFLNTPTLTPTATQTPTPLPTFTPTQQPWQVHFTDDFSSNKYNWPLLDNAVSEGCGTENSYFENNAWIWKVEATGGCVFWRNNGLIAVKDFDVSINVEQLPNSSNGDYGLTIFTLDNSYTLNLTVDPSNSTFTIDTNDTGWKTLIDWTYSSAIHRTGSNRLRIVAQNQTYMFFINGEQMGSTADTVIKSGYVGFNLGTHTAGDSVTMSFDNFELFTNR